MAKGSHGVYGGWEPRTCCYCGGKIKISGRDAPATMHAFSPEGLGSSPRSWHAACWRPSDLDEIPAILRERPVSVSP